HFAWFPFVEVSACLLKIIASRAGTRKPVFVLASVFLTKTFGLGSPFSRLATPVSLDRRSLQGSSESLKAIWVGPLRVRDFDACLGPCRLHLGQSCRRLEDVGAVKPVGRWRHCRSQSRYTMFQVLPDRLAPSIARHKIGRQLEPPTDSF